MSVSREMAGQAAGRDHGAGAATGPRPVNERMVGSELDDRVLADQFSAVRRSVLLAVPVNMMLGFASAVVAARAGHVTDGLVWFGVSTLVNLARMTLCRVPCEFGRSRASDVAIASRHLQLSWIASLASGLVWAFVPVLCDGYASAQTLFYLIVVCGITAGAVTHGPAYARIPLCFIAPPLLSTVGCLLYGGEFDRVFLGATVLLYLVALGVSARQSEAMFRKASRIKNEATALAASLEAAHARSSDLLDEMRHRVTHDPLTGLLNRSGFMQEVESRLARSSARFRLLVLDLDGFRSLNDVFGHKVGDRVLVEVARRLRAALPSDRIVARLGADEFTIFYAPETDDVAADLGARLIGTITRPFGTFDAGRLGVGIGLHDAAGVSLADRMICAGEALDAAKSGGRNRCCVFDENLRNRLEMRRDVERDLARALTERNVEVWFQPIFGQGGSRVDTLEALVRWRHPVHGWVPPNELIVAAALAGVSESLLRYILAEVCAMIVMLRARGRHGVSVAMNVSPREMAQIAVDEIVLGGLRTLGLPPAALEIEITEETALDIAAVKDKLANLARGGVRLAIDDFGVGYSALSSLRQLKAGKVKIDRCFVTGISDSDDDRMLVQAVLSLGRSMGFDVVAEGVETAADLATLRAMGCPYMQGYHLGRPMPAAGILDLIARPAPLSLASVA